MKSIRVEDLGKQYQQNIASFGKEKDASDKHSLWVSIARMIVFLVAVIFIWQVMKTTSPLFWILFVAAVAAFLFLMKYHGKLINRRNFLQKLIQINEEELQALAGNMDAFDGGKEFNIPGHDFALDLDVFGENSLYQKVNRTSTSFGSKKLADWLNCPLLSAEEIKLRQEALKELAPMLEFRQFFRAHGLSVEESQSELDFVAKWKKQPNLFYPKTIFKLLTYLFPLANLSAIALFSLGLLSGQILSLSLIFTLGFVGVYQRKIHRIHLGLGKRTALLEKYMEMLKLMEEQGFHAALLQSLQHRLEENKEKASDSIKELSKILSALDTRLNVFAGVLMNAIFAWDVRQVMRMEAWKAQHVESLEDWFEVIANMDALLSLANLSYNHPQWIFPQFSEGECWQFAEMRHPLMFTEDCVANDFVVERIPHLKVITGANMAGKSTYLRTIGSNMLLAMVGAPVHARSMQFFPMQMVSSLRTTDSLAKSESYFYAEIKRLQMIVQRLRSGEKLFVLLDEILKGTNSKDKEEGSRALLQQLIKLHTVGVVATHDLSLGKLSEDFGEWIENQCFEVDIINDQLAFDYKIRPGVAQNMNASFLLKKMGITE